MILKIEPKSYRNNIKLRVGGLFEHDDFIIKMQEWFHKNHSCNYVDSVYGGLSSSLWHSGRLIKNDSISIEKITSILDAYSSVGIDCNFVFSKINISEDDLKCPISNKLLYVLNYYNRNKNNGVIVTNDLLRDYIKTRYPNLKITCSIIKTNVVNHPNGDETVEYYNSLAESYDRVVMSFHHLIEPDYLKQLKYKDKMEILLTDNCVYDCKYKHMRLTIIDKITNNPNNQEYINQLSSFNDVCLKNIKPKNPNIGINDTYINQLINCGITNIKLATRKKSKKDFILRISRCVYDVIPSFDGIE